MDDFATGYALGQDSNNGGNGNGGMWGGDWIWAFLIFALLGWGNGGIGGTGGGEAVTRAAINDGFAMDNLAAGIRGAQNGICDGFYAVNTGLLNGFAGVNNAVCTLGYQNAQLISGATNDIVAGQRAMEMQLQQCCCDNKAAIADLKYTIATEDCAIRQSVTDAARNIIDNSNANYRGIIDFLTQDKIASLQAENQSLRFEASQRAQNNYLINSIVDRVAPVPRPAYTVPAPYPYCQPQNVSSCAGCGGGY